jgi:hypothetical protein
MRTGILLIFLLSAIPGFSQKFSAWAGAGIGGNFEEKFPYNAKQDKGRLAGQIGLYYQVSDHYSIGIQVMASTRFGAFIGSGTNADYTTGNTTFKNNNNLNAASYFIRNKYSLYSNKSLQWYADLGIGITNYSTGYMTTDQQSVAKTSFAISPELGLQFSRFKFACVMIIGGKTPEFQGFDSFSNSNVSIKSISSQQLYFTAGYNVFRF